jgi:hypothetical protein
MYYAVVWLLLFAVTALFNVLPNPLSVLTVSCPALLYVVPVAICAHFGRWRQSAGLIFGALLAALAGGGVLLLAMSMSGYTASVQLTSAQFSGVVAMSSANAVLIAAMGLPIGIGTARGWTYSRVVVASAAAFCAAAGVYLALCWDAFNRIIDSMIEWFTVQLNLQAADRGQQIVDEQIAGLRWFAENKFALAVGVEFAVYLVLACVFVSITATTLRRRFADPGPIGAFRDLRPPDWLVWAGIVTALMWFAEREYGGVELRFVTWNMAVGLSSIYFLNGCAIFLYGLQVLAPGLFLIAMFVLMMVMTGLYPLLSVIGLFDTWANFRMRMDRLAEAIRNAQSGDGST